MGALLILPMIGAIISVPVACFAVARLYRRLGITSMWIVSLKLAGGFAILSSLLFLGLVGGDGLKLAGLSIIMTAGVMATIATARLALGKWPTSQASDDAP